MKNTKLTVHTKNKSYPIYFGKENLSKIGKLVGENLPGVKKVCIISDKKLPTTILKKIYRSLKKYNLIIYKMATSEKIKNLNNANNIIENLLKNNFNRSDCVIALGGGVIGDLSAFVSSLTKRGLKFVNVPTTLLAQVDASIGGKTGINSHQGKNLIGTFYHPDFVLMDTSVLKSLPKREMICGYGEILKHSLILDKKFFLWLYKNAEKLINKNDKILKSAIIKSCKIKSKIIKLDEKENELRMVLNFGHTFAHGFEGAKNFSKNLNHGEAVLLGMMVASDFSASKKILATKDYNLIKKHYINLNLPMKINNFFKKKEVKKITYFIKKDKKNLTKKINLILIKEIGKTTKPKSQYTDPRIIKKFLESYFN